MSFDWSAHVIAEFKRLYYLPESERLSFFDMAEKLQLQFGGHLTRNACIGKAMRLGWARRGHGLPRPNRPRRPRPVIVERVELKRTTAKMLTRTTQYQKLASRYVILDTEVVDLPDEQIPAAQRRRLFDLTNETCRWPIGEPNSPDFFFCGAPADFKNNRPYCVCHARRAWRVGPAISESERERRSLQMTKLWRMRAQKKQHEREETAA